MSAAAAVQAGEGWALEQDRLDPLRRFRERFALPVGAGGVPIAYLCGNSLGLIPVAARTIVEEELGKWARFGVEGHFSGGRPWYSYLDSIREPLARVVGAQPPEVVAMNSLTINLHLLLVSFYRPEGARRKILMEETAFPSDAYAVESQLAARGIPADALVIARPRAGELTLRVEDLEALIAEHGESLALIWLGAVHYYTGQFFPLERIVRAGHRVGALVGFDLAHAAGNVELELHDWGVDVAVWCCYKYLNAGPGAIGGCFIHERHLGDASIPRLAGWWGNDPATRFLMHSNPHFIPVASADGWLVSNPPILAMAPLVASLALFDDAGMPALRAKSLRLTGYLEQLVEEIGYPGLRPASPRDPGQRGCQLSLQLPIRAKAVVEALRERDVVVDYREPDVIRAAPVPLYNGFHDVWRFARELADLLRSG